MDLLSEEFEKMDDGDPQMMTMLLTRDRVFGEDPGGGDEVEDLQQSLREAVHDEAVQPKMQCLMMDPSFSMVTVQGEDSGIEWETAPSRCSTPWGETTASRCTTPWGASDAAPEFGGGTPVPTSRPSTPGGSGPLAGRIIFVMMDDEMLLKRKKSKGSSSGRRSRAEKPKAPPLEVLDGVSGRPELAEVSLPNVKAEGGREGDEAAGPSEDKEQRLFRVVSDGSEILNIVVPHKLADSVDEEESGAMADNLSYLEETVVVKRKEVNDDVLEPSSDEVAAVSAQAPVGSGGGQRGHGLNRMDPPGAPVARDLPAEGARGEDYFEQFTRMDAQQAPGGPAVVVKEGQEEEEQTEEEEDGEIQESAEPGGQPRRRSTAVAVPVDEGTTEATGGEEFDCRLLDEVFYGGMDDQHSGDEEEESKVDEYVRLKSPLKKSGSALFGSQENILTPIFLPEAPAKIIDLILLEEPKAMPFLYTDLYEEAMGSTETRDEDAESMTSEKSFHSRQSDREDRGYLEKYCLKDETPVAAAAEEVEPAEEEEEREEGGIRVLSQDAAYSDFRPSPEEEGDDVPAAGEEITDFFRSSANSSPCDGEEPFPPVQEEEDVAQSNKKGMKAKEKKLAAKTAVPQTQVQPGKTPEKESVPETAAPLGVSSSKPASVSSGGDSKKALCEKVQIQPLPQTNEGMAKPVAPPRRKSASAVKISLDLAPLTAVEGEEECGVKEQREEEKEKASPAETADEGEGDEKEAGQASSVVVLTEGVPELTTETDTKPGGDTSLLKTGVQPEKGGDRGGDSAEMGASDSPPTSVTEPAKESGRCIIL